MQYQRILLTGWVVGVLVWSTIAQPAAVASAASGSATGTSSIAGAGATAKPAGATAATPPAGATVAMPAAPGVSLSGVQWIGPGLNDTVSGKTTIVMSYVTWCPICAAWAPDLISQLKTASDNKPVVIVAIVTDVGAAAGKDFIQKKGLVGPNVLYGAAPNMDAALGLDKKNLWNYAMVGPTGKVVERGPAGSFSPNGAQKSFVLPRDVAANPDLGKFSFLTADMSAAVKNLVWQLELGNMALLPQIANPKNFRGLSKDEQKSLTDMAAKFLDDQATAIKDLSAGEMPQRLEAFEKANALSTYFRSTEQGKEAGKTVAEFQKDAAFRREVTAKKMYLADHAKAGGNEAQLTKLLRALVVHFGDTYYGGLAKQEIPGSATASEKVDASSPKAGGIEKSATETKNP
jgi:hypothetical protein